MKSKEDLVDPKTTIIFVYNADSGVKNALLDYGKKYVSPSKYDCQLCMVSYGALGMKKDWKNFVKTIPYPVKFLHRDELVLQYPHVEVRPPAMVALDGIKTTVLLDSDDFKAINTLADLKKKVQEVL